jgi:hypothetical protein
LACSGKSNFPSLGPSSFVDLGRCPVSYSYFFLSRTSYTISSIPRPSSANASAFPPSGFFLVRHQPLGLTQSGPYSAPVSYALLHPWSIVCIPAHLMPLIGVGHPLIFVHSRVCRCLTSTDRQAQPQLVLAISRSFTALADAARPVFGLDKFFCARFCSSPLPHLAKLPSVSSLTRHAAHSETFRSE